MEQTYYGVPCSKHSYSWSYSLGWVPTLLSVNNDHTLAIVHHLFQRSIVCSSVVIMIRNYNTHYSFSRRSPYFQKGVLKLRIICYVEVASEYTLRYCESI